MLPSCHLDDAYLETVDGEDALGRVEGQLREEDQPESLVGPPEDSGVPVRGRR